jgi:AraC family transcriptional regulator, regulatory protein of adaptative response / DNA-3-methyladenine glycosylase II
VAGVEELTADGTYRRTLRLAHGPAVAALHPGAGGVELGLDCHPDDTADAVARCRHLLDLDTDIGAVDAHLAADPLLAPLVARRPGLRRPGHPDPTELATRAILGQQVSVAGARTLAGRLVAAHGTPLAAPDGALTHLFPDAATIAALPDSAFAMPRARSAALARTAAAIAAGELDLRPDADPDTAREGLLALKGIGPWTAGYIAMRALGDPDAWLPTDVGVRHGLARIGADASRAERWRPFRSYALMHLWAVLGDP